VADLQLPQLKLQSSVVTDDCTGDRQVQAANSTLTVLSSAAWHGNGEDLVASIPDRIG
tara:strand:+ start:405 stop:578 length:174 start_codon:yes stop_codon:yes gene_type:complete